MSETGLSFSGGGIRSAAFCSGVLRRLLQRNCKIDYLSCVSGGGYTGTAYLDWKYRNGKKDDPKWHQEFFDHMRENAGLMCNWQRPFRGIFDTVILLSLMLLVSAIMPIIVWGSYLFPFVYMVDYLFGDILKADDECDSVPHDQRQPRIIFSSPDNNTEKVKENVTGTEPQRDHCMITMGSEAYTRIVMFATLITLFVSLYLLSKKVQRFRSVLYFLSSFCGLLFAFTYIPFFIFYFFDRTPLWTRLLVFMLSIVAWLFFPVLRRKSSFVVVVYLYSYAVYWKVYQSTLFGITYSDYLFFRLLFASGIILWIVPALGAIQQRLVYVFNRWRLQSAFYTHASVGRSGCRGIGIEDIFLVTNWSTSHRNRLNDNDFGPLTLRDLKGIKPEYLSNIVVNEWIINETDDNQKKYELLIMSPTKIERLDRPEGQEQFENKLDPGDIDLSAAMATSAAAVARHMGAYNQSAEGFKQLQTVLGLGMGSSMVSDNEALKRENIALRALPYVIEAIRVLPLVSFPLVYFVGGEKMEDEKWVAIGVLIFFAMLFVLMIISTLKTGRENPRVLEKVTRFKVHYYKKKSIFEQGIKAGEGEILLLCPRHPDRGIKQDQTSVTWKGALHDINADLEAGKWGIGPQQDAEEVDSLTFCCCESCHGSYSLKSVSNAMCGAFPQHITANQFFTPRMFRAYHCEGYNACMEANAADFLNSTDKGNIFNEFQT